MSEYSKLAKRQDIIRKTLHERKDNDKREMAERSSESHNSVANINKFL